MRATPIPTLLRSFMRSKLQKRSVRSIPSTIGCTLQASSTTSARLLRIPSSAMTRSGASLAIPSLSVASTPTRYRGVMDSHKVFNAYRACSVRLPRVLQGESRPHAPGVQHRMRNLQAQLWPFRTHHEVRRSERDGTNGRCRSWGHDEYMYQVCIGNGCTLPDAALVRLLPQIISPLIAL